MDKKEYREKAAELLRGYRQRNAAARMIELDIETLKNMPDTSTHAIDYSEPKSGKTNKIASSVESIVLSGERREAKILELQNKLIRVNIINQEIDMILASMTEDYSKILKLRYIKGLTWVQVSFWLDYSDSYIRRDLNRAALDEFIGIYYGVLGD